MFRIGEDQQMLPLIGQKEQRILSTHSSARVGFWNLKRYQESQPKEQTSWAAMAQCLHCSAANTKHAACPCQREECPSKPRRTSRWCRNSAWPSGSLRPIPGKVPGGRPPWSPPTRQQSCWAGTCPSGLRPWAASLLLPAGSWLYLQWGLWIQQQNVSPVCSDSSYY